MARTQKSQQLKAQKAQSTQKPRNKDAWVWYLGAIVFVVVMFLFASSQVGTNKPTGPSSNTTQSQPSQTTELKPSQPSEEPATTTQTKPVEATETQPTQTAEPVQTKPTTSMPTEPTPPSTTAPSANDCYHFESGCCWDDLEDEAYSAGIYDREYGYYGATLEYPDDCDAFCRDTLEDAYDEGWYDAF